MKRRIYIYVLLLVLFLPFQVYAGEIINLKEFDTLDSSTNIIKDSNQNLIRTSLEGDSPCLIKTDSNNNIIWKKVFDDNIYLEMKGLTIDEQDNIYITISKKEPITRIDNLIVNSSRYNSYIIKLDKNGNILFEKEMDYNDEILPIYQLYDLEYLNGYIYASGTEALNIHFSEFKEYNIDDPVVYVKYAHYDGIVKDVLIKMEKNGNILWERNYGNEKNNTYSFTVEGYESGHFSFTTFNRKKYYVRQDSIGSIYVLAVKDNKTAPSSYTSGSFIGKYSLNGEEIFLNEIDKNIYTTDFIIDEDKIVLVGKKYKEYNPPNPKLSYEELKALTDEDRIEYEKKDVYNYNPIIYYLNLDGSVEKEILLTEYDRSLFHSIIKIREDYIVQMCSYNDTNNRNECFDTVLSDDKTKIAFKGVVNHVSEGVQFWNSYTLEEGLFDESNNEYYLLVSDNSSYAVQSRVIIAKYIMSYGKIVINNDESQGLFKIEGISQVKETTLKRFNIKPQSGYQLVKIEIADSNGNKVEYRKTKNENEYEFVMPDSDVTITPVYKRIENVIINPNTGNKMLIIILILIPCIGIGISTYKKKESN
jgi:hypothetical protein